MDHNVVVPNGTASVIVAQPVDVVWNYISDPRNAATVLPGLIHACSDTEPPFAPGDSWHGTSRFCGIRFEWTGVFTKVSVNEVMEFESTSARFPFFTTDSVQEVADGTLYTCRVMAEPAFGGPVGRAIDVAASKMYTRVLAKHLARLPGHIDDWSKRN